MSGRLTKVTFKIANGGTTSAAVDLTGHRLLALSFPAALTSATFTLTASVNNNTPAEGEAADPFSGVVDDTSTALSFTTVAADDYMVLDAHQLDGLMFAKLVASGAEGAERIIFGVCEVRGI